MERRGEIIRIEKVVKQKKNKSDTPTAELPIERTPDYTLIEQLGEQILEFWSWAGFLEEPKSTLAEIIEFKTGKPVA